MTHLERLERDILAEHGSICLRPTLEAVERVGGWLLEAKAMVPHGRWLPWVRRLRLTPRTAQNYMAVARAANTHHVSHLAGKLTVGRFLKLIRRAGRRAFEDDREAERDRLAASGAAPDGRYTVTHADCRTWGGWPSEVGAIATDPPWACAESYRWLAEFAAKRLTPGGLLLVQCGQHHLADRIETLRAAGLVYRYTLAVVYSEVRSGRPFAGWLPAWRPVLVFSRGDMPRRPRAVCDVQTVRESGRTFHKWEQPVSAWRYWIERLTPPGCVVADPFSGGGSIGVAVVRAGGNRRYVGTEVDGRAARVAAARLAGETGTPGA
jgi:hypothetical protein